MKIYTTVRYAWGKEVGGRLRYSNEFSAIFDASSKSWVERPLDGSADILFSVSSHYWLVFLIVNC